MDSEHPNRATIEITEQLAVIEADGFLFYRGRKSNDFQCVTCLAVTGLVGRPEDDEGIIDKNGKRRIVLQKDCDCPRQGGKK